MDNKTKIKFIRDGLRFKAGDTGYIDGYVMERGVAPCAIVVKDADNKFVSAYLYDIIKI